MNTELAFKKGISVETQKMLDTFTWEENMNIAFVPLIISYIAWAYADKVIAYCADHKISDTKKLSRVIKEVKQKYKYDLEKDLDHRHMKALDNETERFMGELSSEFAILWFSVNNEIKRVYPSLLYDEMRTDAMISMMMIKFLRQHNAKMDELVKRKMHVGSCSIENPYMDALFSAMDAYFGECTLSYNKHMDTWVKIFQNHIKSIRFELV